MSMMPLTAALLVSNRTLWEPAHTCIQNLPVRIAMEQNEADNLDALLDRIEMHRVDVLLVELALLPIPLEDFARRVRATTSLPAIFVLHLDASVNHIMEAIHAGTSEFLYPPLADTLRQAFERLSASRTRASASTGGLGKAVGFISAKGGCGATTFAAHVAVNVAKQTQKPVLLGDFDFEAGLMRFLFKARTTYSVKDAIDNMHRLDASYWKALVSTYGNLVDVLPSPEDVAARRSGGAHETCHLMRFIRSTYDNSIFDFGRHHSSAALDSLSELDALYVITTMDLEALEQTRQCIAAVASREYSSRVRILLNRTYDHGTPDRAGMESFLGMPVAGIFSNDADALYEAWSEGRFLPPKSTLGKELQALAKSITTLNQAQPAPAEKSAAQRPANRWLSFLKKAQA